MENYRYRVVFDGEVLEGYCQQQAMANLAHLLKHPLEKIEALFSGKEYPLKKQLDHITAQNYVKALETKGVVCRIKPCAPAKPKLELELVPIEKDEHENNLMTAKRGEQASAAKDPNYRGRLLRNPANEKAQTKQSKYQADDPGRVVRDKVAKPASAKAADKKAEEVETELASESFLDLVAQAFKFPAQQGGWSLIVAGGIFFLLLDLLSFLPIVSIFLAIFAGGYMSAFMLRIIDRSAMGDRDVPNWPEFSDFMSTLVKPLVRMLAVLLACAAPAILASLYTESLLLMAITMLWGCFSAPAALLCIATTESVTALNPVFLIRIISSILGEYMIACLLLLATSVFAALTQMLGLTWLAFITYFISIYLTVVQMKIIGFLAYANQQKLADKLVI